MRKWRALTDGVTPTKVAPAVLAALSDDINTAGAVAELHKLAAAGDAGALKASAQLMGLLDDAMGDWVKVDVASDDASALIEELLAARKQARQDKDFARADVLRDGFAAAGVLVKDTADGVVWELLPEFDAAKLKVLK